jgi:hypothetical protein
MKNCTDCKHAEWKRNAAGNLHPSGDGKCALQYKVPPLPACMYWLTQPVPYARTINRKAALDEHCVYYTNKRYALAA